MRDETTAAHDKAQMRAAPTPPNPHSHLLTLLVPAHPSSNPPPLILPRSCPLLCPPSPHPSVHPPQARPRPCPRPCGRVPSSPWGRRTGWRPCRKQQPSSTSRSADGGPLAAGAANCGTQPAWAEGGRPGGQAELHGGLTGTPRSCPPAASERAGRAAPAGSVLPLRPDACDRQRYAVYGTGFLSVAHCNWTATVSGCTWPRAANCIVCAGGGWRGR